VLALLTGVKIMADRTTTAIQIEKSDLAWLEKNFPAGTKSEMLIKCFDFVRTVL